VAEILIADYPGHPCPVHLARTVAKRGVSVDLVYCPDVPSGRGDLADAHEPDLRIIPVSIGEEVQRYRLSQRIRQEILWGRLLMRQTRSTKPAALVISNLPLLSQLVVVARRRRRETKLILWQQDVHSVAIGAVATRRFGVAGRLIGWLASRLEALPARSADAVFTISPAFRASLEAWKVDPTRITDFPNWAPIDELPVTERDTAWRIEVGLDSRPVVLYSGTLGLKHDPMVIVRVAEALLRVEPEGRVVVISEGVGRTRIEAELVERPDLPIITLDYQDYERLPAVLGSADVLLAVLEDDAGEYSVPSKVLTYLCAARPVLGVIPGVNGAARTIRESGAGVVVEPRDAEGPALEKALRELLDPARGRRLGASARTYAERQFDVEAKADLLMATARPIG
jgi:glycosyltransferase involved in cell wall biosynthesis